MSFRDTDSAEFRNALDRHIMGDPPDYDDEDDEDEFYSCRRPGRYGCGTCDACEAWADAEYDAWYEDQMDRELDDGYMDY